MLDRPLSAPPKKRYSVLGCAAHWTVFDQLTGRCLTGALTQAEARASADKREIAWALACLRYIIAEGATK